MIKLNVLFVFFQSHVYGDARSPEDQQQDSDFHDAGCLPRRSQNPGGVPQPRPL